MTMATGETAASAAHPGPLRGMRVLELAQIMAGPTCGMLLADMGADVIKVEKLPGGDDARGYREPRVNGVSAPFMMLNRNKRGIALNLKVPAGREVLLRMVRDADVLTENYRRGTLEKLGLGYDVLSGVNPGLIYCAVSGYGRTGPAGDKGGFDLIAQGFAGLMSITGEPGRPPGKPGKSGADKKEGLLAALCGAAWLALWLWGESPYARYLDHGNWTQIGLAATLCHARPGGGETLGGLLVVGGWVLMLVAMMLPTTSTTAGVRQPVPMPPETD